ERGEAPPPAASVATQDIVMVTDPAALAEITGAGGDLGSLLHGRAAASARELAAGPRYASVARVLEADVRAISLADPKAGVGIRGTAHRLFDLRWLRSPSARYELVAVVNRLDRIPLTPGACGDVRLV